MTGDVAGKQGGASAFKQGEGKGHPSPAVRRQIHNNPNQQQHGKHRRSRSLRTTGTKATRGTSCSASRTQSTASRQSSQRTRGRFGKSGGHHRGRSGGKHSRHNRRKKKSRPASAGKQQQQPGENTLLYKQSVQYYKQFLKSIHSVKSVSEYFNSKTAKSGEGRP